MVWKLVVEKEIIAGVQDGCVTEVNLLEPSEQHPLRKWAEIVGVIGQY